MSVLITDVVVWVLCGVVSTLITDFMVSVLITDFVASVLITDFVVSVLITDLSLIHISEPTRR